MQRYDGLHHIPSFFQEFLSGCSDNPPILRQNRLMPLKSVAKVFQRFKTITKVPDKTTWTDTQWSASAHPRRWRVRKASRNLVLSEINPHCNFLCCHNFKLLFLILEYCCDHLHRLATYRLFQIWFLVAKVQNKVIQTKLFANYFIIIFGV